ncbi:G5 domain-containing protein [Macrococcus equi]|uniref:G5 domain-containing protein n=1 Tax=Macrococcus equi TaxID=3395462 RepID=UPI0039BDF93B
MKKIIASSLALTVLMSGVQIVSQEQTVYAAKSKVKYKFVNKKTELNYKTIEEKTDTLLVGEKKVKTPGKNGYKIVTFKQTLKKGKVVKSKFIKTKEKVKPVDEVVLIGTKQAVNNEPVKPAVTEPKEKYELIKVRQPLDFDTIYQDDPTLEKGKQVVVQEGKKGVREKAYNQRIINGQASTTPAYVLMIEAPVNRIVKVGTKPVEKIEELKVRESLDFDTTYQDDPTLEKGKQVVVQEGKNGIREKVYNQRIVDGKVTSTLPAYVLMIEAPVNRIVKVGTKPVETYEELKVREPYPFNTIWQNDPTIEIGKQIVVQEGKDGIREKVYSQRIIDGKVVSTTRAYVTVIQEPVNKIVKVGTKK